MVIGIVAFPADLHPQAGKILDWVGKSNQSYQELELEPYFNRKIREEINR